MIVLKIPVLHKADTYLKYDNETQNFYSHTASRNLHQILCQNPDSLNVCKISRLPMHTPVCAYVSVCVCVCVCVSANTHTLSLSFNFEPGYKFSINRTYHSQEHYQTARKV